MSEIVVVGAGVAGLSAAMALARVGVEVVVVEASSDDHQRTSGAFLNLAPNGVKALDALGLGPQVRGIGSVSTAIEFRNAAGRVIAEVSSGEEVALHGASNLMVRRTDLVSMLLDGARRTGVSVVHDAPVTRIVEADASVEVELATGRHLIGEAVIGADGVGSKVRSQLLGINDSRVHSFPLVDIAGITTSTGAGLPIGRQVMTFANQAFFGSYAHPNGEVWWFANVNNTALSTDDVTGEDWRNQLYRLVRDAPRYVSDIIERTPELLGPWPVTDLDPLPTWHSQRVCLIGDAAHASSPSAGQGASLAVEDALVLASTWAEAGSTADAFDRFEAQRKPRTENAVKVARRNTRTKHPTGAGAWVRDLMLPLFLRIGARHTTDLYNWKPPALVVRP